MKGLRGLSLVGILCLILAVAHSGAVAGSSNVPTDTIEVSMTVPLSSTHSVLDNTVRQPIIVSISENLTHPSITYDLVSIESSFLLPTDSQVFENGVLQPRNTIQFAGTTSAGTYLFQVLINSNTTSYRISFEGSVTDDSLIWRNTFVAPFFKVGTISNSSVSYLTTLVLPKGDVVVFSDPQVPGSSAGGSIVLRGTAFLSGFFFYQSSAWAPVAYVLSLMMLPILVGIPLVLKYRPSLFSRMPLQVRKGPRTIRLEELASNFKTLELWVWQRLSKYPYPSPRKFLALFLACTMLMVSIGYAFGPDPSYKIYVIGIHSRSIEISGVMSGIGGVPVTALTPADTLADFPTMAGLGVFRAVVVSNYSAFLLPTVEGWTIQAMKDVNVIFLDGFSNSTATGRDFSTKLQILYPSKIVHVGNWSHLTGPEFTQIQQTMALSEEANHLGLNLSPGTYKAALASSAALSLGQSFLGFAFLSSYVTLPRKEEESKIQEALAYSIFLFFVIEGSQFVTGVLLGTPLGLHAVLSGSKNVTGLGLLGFGGGSGPRLALGFAGFLVGAFPAIRMGTFDKRGIYAISVASLFVVLNPGITGEIANELLMSFTGGPTIGFTSTLVNNSKTLLASIGVSLGGWITSDFGISTGKMLFFSGAVLLPLLGRLRKGTATLMLPIVAFMMADGGVRMAELTPEKTIASMFPGLVVGFLIALFALGLSKLETVVEERGTRI